MIATLLQNAAPCHADLDQRGTGLGRLHSDTSADGEPTTTAPGSHVDPERMTPWTAVLERRGWRRSPSRVDPALADRERIIDDAEARAILADAAAAHRAAAPLADGAAGDHEEAAALIERVLQGGTRCGTPRAGGETAVTAEGGANRERRSRPVDAQEHVGGHGLPWRGLPGRIRREPGCPRPRGGTPLRRPPAVPLRLRGGARDAHASGRRGREWRCSCWRPGSTGSSATATSAASSTTGRSRRPRARATWRRAAPRNACSGGSTRRSAAGRRRRQPRRERQRWLEQIVSRLGTAGSFAYCCDRRRRGSVPTPSVVPL